MRRLKKDNSGQIVIEYILLLVIVVAIGALLVSLLVKRDPENPGVLVKKWQDILVVIGSDISD